MSVICCMKRPEGAPWALARRSTRKNEDNQDRKAVRQQRMRWPFCCFFSRLQQWVHWHTMILSQLCWWSSSTSVAWPPWSSSSKIPSITAFPILRASPAFIWSPFASRSLHGESVLSGKRPWQFCPFPCWIAHHFWPTTLLWFLEA